MPLPLENLPSREQLFQVARGFLTLTVPDATITDWVNAFYEPSTRNISHLTQLTGMHNRTLTRLHRHILSAYPELGRRYGRMFPSATRGNQVRRRGKQGKGEERKLDPEAIKSIDKSPIPERPEPPDLSKIATKEGQIEALTQFMWQAAQEGDYRQFVQCGDQRAKLEGDYAPEVSLEYQVQSVLPEGGALALPNEITRLLGELKAQGLIPEAEVTEIPEKPLLSQPSARKESE